MVFEGVIWPFGGLIMVAWNLSFFFFFFLFFLVHVGSDSMFFFFGLVCGVIVV